jgi:nucleoid-associated protein YgaU
MPAAATTIIVAPGDSIWSIASAHLERSTGRPVRDDEVVSLWVQMVEVNRPRLVDPSSPDLIYAGQELVVPSL